VGSERPKLPSRKLFHVSTAFAGRELAAGAGAALNAGAAVGTLVVDADAETDGKEMGISDLA
jgi:hypothetical protein